MQVSSAPSLRCQAQRNHYQCCLNTLFRLPRRAVPCHFKLTPQSSKGKWTKGKWGAPVNPWRVWNEAGVPKVLRATWVIRMCKGTETRMRGRDDCLLSPETGYSELLLKEKMLELSHIRQGSGPSNWLVSQTGPQWRCIFSIQRLSQIFVA